MPLTDASASSGALRIRATLPNSTSRRVFKTGPMPGTNRFGPADSILEQERQWSMSTGVAWEWFDKGGPLESRGERRALIVRFLDTPALEPTEDGARLQLALPPGSYATEVLRELGVEVPRDRRGA